MVAFGDEERRIKGLLSVGSSFNKNGESYTIEFCGKPTCSKGEPKTDIYTIARNNNTKKIKELKISFKKKNADFLENKINPKRAEQILGVNWSNIISESTGSISENFDRKHLIYKAGFGRTEEGSFTLGWKFEFLNKIGGDLSGKIKLTKEQMVDIYAGTNLAEDKRHAFVNGRKIQNSGIANYILINENVNTTQEVINSIISINKYVDLNPSIYFACKALNYRSFSKKWDGNRPLAVFIRWSIINNQLVSELIYDRPLVVKGNEVARNLLYCLNTLGIENTNGLSKNMYDSSKIFG